MANAPENSDTNFTWEHFASVVNKDLADVLGNFVNRITKFCAARFDGKVPGEGEYGAEEHALIAELETRVDAYTDHLEALEFRKALGELRAIWVAGNEYLTRPRPGPRSRPIARARPSACAWGSTSCICSGICAGRSFRMRAARFTKRFSRRRDIIPWPEGPMAELLDQLEPGSRSPCRTCCSPRSPTSKSPNGACASAGRA